MAKLVSIKRWADRNGYEVIYNEYLENHIIIETNMGVRFKVSSEESTAFYSIHGWEGQPKGIDFSHKIDSKSQYSRSFRYNTQKEVIGIMETIINTP